MTTDLEKRVEKLEQWMDHLPRIIRTSFDQAEAQRDVMKAQIARLRTDFGALRADLGALRAELAAVRVELKTDIADVRSELSAKIDAIPRAIAELLAERK